MKTKLQKVVILMTRMSIYALIVCQSFAMALPRDSEAQRSLLAEIPIHIDNLQREWELVELIAYIESNSEFKFSYSENTIKSLSLSLYKEDWVMMDLLKEISSQGKISIKRVNENISLKRIKGDFTTSQVSEAISVQTTVKGVIIDENGDVLPGATIQSKGSTNGTIADGDGNFSLQVEDGAVLIISFVGYETKEVPVNGKVVFEIEMSPDFEALDEVVVVGYGTVNKSDLTGSVAKITSEDLQQNPGGSFDQMLRGRLAGVNITQQSGAPGAASNVNIRGFNSLFGDSQPLYVIDGYPIDVSSSTSGGTGGDIFVSGLQAINPLAQINPEDIESIEVLKDASSTAIYGSRGANGVIMITTKTGKKGSNKISYSNRFEVSEVNNSYDVLNTEEFINYQNEAFLADWDTETNGQPAPEDYPFRIDKLDSIFGANSDTKWQDEIYRQAITQNHSLSFTGADEVNRYNLSINYYDQEGVIINSDFTRINTRLNVSRKLNEIVEVGINSNYTLTNSRAAAHSFVNGNPGGSVVIGSIFFRPLDGVTQDQLEDDFVQNNPITVANKRLDDNRITQNYNSIFVNINLLDGLDFRANGGYNNVTTERNIYMPRGTFRGDQLNGFASRVNSFNSNYLIESNLHYNKTIAGGHTINAVAGWSWQEWNARRRVTQTSNFINDVLGYENFGASTVPFIPESSHIQWALASVITRVNYSFQSKYLFTFTSRYDGSTRLGEGNKWDFFPSAAIGWNVHKESFMEPVLSAVSRLKLRASYGVSGNQSIGVNSLQQLYSPSLGAIDGGLETSLNGVGGTFANPNLFWETSTQLDIGADIGLLDDRISFGVDYYTKTSENLLLNQQVGPSSGYSSVAINAGKVENQGLEIEFNAAVIDQEFGWSVSGNLTRNTNTLVEYPVDQILGQNFISNANIVANEPVSISMVGNPLGMFYGYKVLGIYQNQEQIDNAALLDSEKAGIRPGDYIYEDVPRINEQTGEFELDSVINASDRQIIGNPYPDFTFGFNNTFTFKRFTLDINIQGSVGNDVINLNQYALNDPNTSSNWNILRKTYENAWRGEGSTNEYRSLRSSGIINDGVFNDRLIEDASFIRLNNIKLTYDLNMSAISFVDRLTVFIGGRNLFLLTDYTGYDPEVSGFGSSAMTQAVDWGTYPNPKTYYTGLNLTF